MKVHVLVAGVSKTGVAYFSKYHAFVFVDAEPITPEGFVHVFTETEEGDNPFQIFKALRRKVIIERRKRAIVCVKGIDNARACLPVCTTCAG